MIIPVTGPDGEVKEWAMVELQGKIDVLDESQALSEVGTLLWAPAVRGHGGRRGSTGG